MWGLSGNVTNLNVASGYYAQVFSVNRNGESVGSICQSQNFSGPSEPVVWSAQGAMTVLSYPGGAGYSYVAAINDLGETVGGYGYYTQYEALAWSPNGTPISLYQPSTVDNVTITGSWAYCVNGSGEIGGELRTSNSGDIACEWASDGSIAWTGGKDTYITHINPSGSAGGFDHKNPVIWSSTGVETRLRMPSTPYGVDATFNQFVGLSGDGKSVGNVLVRDNPRSNFGDETAILWSASGKPTELSRLGHQESEVSGININGDSVGECFGRNGTGIPVYWDSAGNATNLQSILGSEWTDAYPTGIDNNGDIIGDGFFDGNQSELAGFILHNSLSGTATRINEPISSHLHEMTITAHI